MNETDLLILFLQTIHYRDDLESSLLTNLSERTSSYTQDNINNIYGQRVHKELLEKTLLVLMEFGVLTKLGSVISIDQIRLKHFIDSIQFAKKIRDYRWPDMRIKPYLYISPPSLISKELSGDIDDISSFLTNLVGSAHDSVTIVSPFTNKEGLISILSPLKATRSHINISLFLTAKKRDRSMLYDQIINIIPNHLRSYLKIFYSTDTTDDKLPHAKLLIIDSIKGYLGSANFTKQGLKTRFEVGVELDIKQSKTILNLIKILIKQGFFIENSQGSLINN